MSSIESVRHLLNSILCDKEYVNAKVDITPVSSGGANYTTELYEITVTQQDKDTLHLFAKSALMNDNIRNVLLDAFEVEEKVYKKLATAYDEIQEKHRIPKDDRFIFTEFYGSSLEVGKEIFIFENVNLKGYQIFDRFTPIDKQCMFGTTTELAKFHALGLALKKERPELYKQFEFGGMITKFENFIDSSREQAQNYVNALDEPYRGKLQKFIDTNGYIDYKKIINRKRTFLVHGDYRGSNIFYKKESGQVKMIPVDYQCVHAGNPLLDLFFLITLGTDETFRVNHFDELMVHYYTQLTSYSSKLGVDVNDVYPKKVFQDDLKELLPGTLLWALVMLPLIMVETEAAPVVQDMTELSSFFVKQNAKSTERLMGYIRDCERWGII